MRLLREAAVSESPEARARRRPSQDPAFRPGGDKYGRVCAHGSLARCCVDCDVAWLEAELLRLESEAEALRRERDEARERANMRFDEATTYLQQWQRDAGELRNERDAALRSNAELRGMLAEALNAKSTNELAALACREDVQRACLRH